MRCVLSDENLFLDLCSSVLCIVACIVASSTHQCSIECNSIISCCVAIGEIQSILIAVDKHTTTHPHLLNTTMTSPVPIAIAAVAFYQLLSSGTLDTLIDAFFTLPITSQISIFALIFSTIFLAVSISQFIDPLGLKDGKEDEHKAPKFISYPIDKMAKCTNDKDKFMEIYPMLRDEMLTHMKQSEMPPAALEWSKTMMDYTVPGGKLNRGLTVVAVHRTLTQANHGRDLTEREVARASVLGWAIEFLQAFFLVADDVMDASETRRGQPCWYKNEHVKLIAINDSFLLESYVFSMLKEHFSHEDYYLQLVELFLQVIQQTEFGQLLDLTSQDENVVDLDKFTLERYQKIVKYKTAFYTFYLPVAIGMITSGVKEKSAFELARTICCQMGEYFQIQDDYLDCFGDPSVIGKGKCKCKYNEKLPNVLWVTGNMVHLVFTKLFTFLNFLKSWN